MQQNLSRSLQLMFGDEGGYVNNPKDPGGATKYGVTIKTLRAWRSPKSVTVNDVKSLTLDEATKIARSEYWNAIRGDELPSGLDYAVFDYAYNSGPAQATKTLQRIVGATADGVIGVKTLDVIRKYIKQKSLETLIQSYCHMRMTFLKSLKTWGTFGRGWTRRVTGVDPKGIIAKELGVIGNALSLAKGYVIESPKHVDQVAIANPNDTKVTTTTEGQAASLAGVGALGVACTEAANQLAPFTDAIPIAKWAFTALTILGVGFGFFLSIKRIKEGNV